MEDEWCTADIHFNQSVAGQCVELKLEGNIAAIPSYTYRNICVPQQTPETGKSIISLIIFVDAVQMLLSAGSCENVLGYFCNLGSLRYGNEYCKYGKITFFPFTEAFFNHAVITARDWFV